MSLPTLRTYWCIDASKGKPEIDEKHHESHQIAPATSSVEPSRPSIWQARIRSSSPLTLVSSMPIAAVQHKIEDSSTDMLCAVKSSSPNAVQAKQNSLLIYCVRCFKCDGTYHRTSSTSSIMSTASAPEMEQEIAQLLVLIGQNLTNSWINSESTRTEDLFDQDQHWIVSNVCTVSAISFLLYDVLINLDREVSLRQSIQWPNVMTYANPVLEVEHIWKCVPFLSWVVQVISCHHNLRLLH